MGLSILFLGFKIANKYSYTTQVGTPIKCRGVSWSLTISCRISSYGSISRNWSCLTSTSCGFWWWIFHISTHEGRHNIPKLDRSCVTQITKRCNRKKMTSITLGSLQILIKAPVKPQVMRRLFPQRIIIALRHHSSPYSTQNKYRSVIERLSLKWSNVQFLSESETN